MRITIIAAIGKWMKLCLELLKSGYISVNSSEAGYNLSKLLK